MKSFFLHPTVKKVCYVVGLLTIAGWLLSGLGKGTYHTADYMGWIPDHVKENYIHDDWDENKRWKKRHAKRFKKFCEELDNDEELQNDKPTTEGT